MNLIALAVPFFLLALLAELAIDRWRGTGYYRSNDAINSLSAGILSETTGYFTKILQYTIWGLVLSNLALFDIQRSWFDASASGIGLWILAGVLWDFCYYWNHRLGHEISVLWAAHSVHHQSEEYNLSTALRQTSSSFIFSWIFYVPLFLIGFPADVVHHAQNEAYIDKNYGGIFILWDRLFGTFAEESDDEPVVFGVRKALANWNPIWANLQVYDYLLFDAKNTERWQDKLSIWFRRTGWRPTDVAAAYPKHPVDLKQFRKYDPPVSAARRSYVMAQFAVTILSALLIAEAFAVTGAKFVFVPCILLWTQLYTLGLLNEDRPYAVRFELLRLIVVLPIGLLAMDATLPTMTPLFWIIVSSYVLGSLLWLKKN